MRSTPSVCPPPSKFRPVGDVLWARPQLVKPSFIHRPKRRKGRKGQGVRYEAAVGEYLRQQTQALFLGPWIQFQDTISGLRWCQPDAIIFDPLAGKMTIVEVKYQHTADAWWQLKHLYLPVVRALFPSSLWELSVLEIVKWYDPLTAFPERVLLCPDPLEMKAGAFGVHIWKP